MPVRRPTREPAGAAGAGNDVGATPGAQVPVRLQKEACPGSKEASTSMDIEEGNLDCAWPFSVARRRDAEPPPATSVVPAMEGTYANVRIGSEQDGLPSVGNPPALLAVPGALTCSECGIVLGRRRHPTTFCSPRCRAAASRRRRIEAELAKLASAEAALLAALSVVHDLRAEIARRSP